MSAMPETSGLLRVAEGKKSVEQQELRKVAWPENERLLCNLSGQTVAPGPAATHKPIVDLLWKVAIWPLGHGLVAADSREFSSWHGATLAASLQLHRFAHFTDATNPKIDLS